MTKNLKAIYEQGLLRLAEPLPLRDGAQVDVTLTLRGAGGDQTQEMTDHSWHTLTQLLKDCAIDTGIPVFAHHHDRHLYRH